eukprot:4798015-Prymnesium_polylepis.1
MASTFDLLKLLLTQAASTDDVRSTSRQQEDCPAVLLRARQHVAHANGVAAEAPRRRSGAWSLLPPLDHECSILQACSR